MIYEHHRSKISVNILSEIMFMVTVLKNFFLIMLIILPQWIQNQKKCVWLSLTYITQYKLSEIQSSNTSTQASAVQNESPSECDHPAALKLRDLLKLMPLFIFFVSLRNPLTISFCDKNCLRAQILHPDFTVSLLLLSL